MNQIHEPKPNDGKVYEIYSNGNSIIEAEFTKWNTKKQITEIKIVSSTIKKKIEDVTYCEETDAIEIHYYKNTNEPFKSETYELKDCFLNAVRFLLLEYDLNENIQQCSSINTSITNPKVKKGNIIVGNP